MDPASALALALSINDIVSKLYTLGKDLKDGPDELGRLCTELFALQAALNHVAMNMRFASTDHGAIPTALLKTDQFNIIMATAKTLLDELLQRLQKHRTGLSASLKHRLTWAWSKDDVKDYLVRLERIKSYLNLVTTSDNFELSQLLFEEVRSIRIAQVQNSQTRLQSELKQWLGVFDCQQLHQQALTPWQAGTGQWFLKGQFLEWSSCQGGTFQAADAAHILWLRGKSGSGKTTMLSSAINDYSIRSSESQGPPHAYFYCTFKTLSTQDPSVILASFIAQLCDQRVDLWTNLVQRFQDEQPRTGNRPQKPNLIQLEKLMSMVSKNFEELCLFLDAPNESVQSKTILESLGNVMSQHTGLRLCLSSTGDLEVHTIARHRLRWLSIDMQKAGMVADIEAYILHILQEDEVFHDLPTQLRDHIKAGIMSRANGSFRWVDCQLRSLALQDTVAEMEEALDTLSGSLEDHYQSILLAIPQKDRGRARTMLFWLTFQSRPMTSKELAEAVILKDGMVKEIDQRHRLVHGKIEYYIRICRSLVNYDAEKDTVSLAHSSVKAYLMSSNLEHTEEAGDFFLDESSARVILVRRCLQYLLQPAFGSGYSEPRSNKKQRYRAWPLYKYCADSWPVYLQMVDDEYVQSATETQQLLLSFLETRHMPRGGNYGAWLERYLPTHLDGGKKKPISTPLNVAAREGLHALVKLILLVQGAQDLEIPGGSTMSTPLHRACAFGHVEVVRTLLAAGANVHEVNGRGLSGTYWANRFGHRDIVKLMLDSGVDPCRSKMTGTSKWHGVRE